MILSELKKRDSFCPVRWQVLQMRAHAAACILHFQHALPQTDRDPLVMGETKSDQRLDQIRDVLSNLSALPKDCCRCSRPAAALCCMPSGKLQPHLHQLSSLSHHMMCCMLFCFFLTSGGSREHRFPAYLTDTPASVQHNMNQPFPQ